MARLQSLTIGTRLGLSFGGALVMLVVVSVLALSGQRDIAIAATFISCLSGLVAAVLVTRSILAQLGGEPDYVSGIAEEIALGKLDVEIRRSPHDRGSILAHVEHMRDGLSRIVGDVRSGGETIASATAQIAAGNQDMSDRVEQQASSLEQTAASLEEISEAVRATADNARSASEVARAVTDVASKGGEAVAELVFTMAEISQASSHISQIVGMIDGIAFQTNILALNAAVEAARAGAEGRGFAVVAEEVRSLSKRSADAARQIRILIEESVTKAQMGSDQVLVAQDAIADTINQTHRVAELMAQIDSATGEQSSGIAQVNEAMTDMDRMTQQNAALVEQSAAAAHSLRDQAQRLAQAIGTFHAAGVAPQAQP